MESRSADSDGPNLLNILNKKNNLSTYVSKSVCIDLLSYEIKHIFRRNDVLC